MNSGHPFLESCDEILRGELPNLLRLYVNPHVTQACFCLERYVQTTWNDEREYQTFLANGFDEALGGAIKLARYCASVEGRPSNGLVVDPGNRLGPFAGVTVAEGSITFVPGLTVVGREKGDVRQAVASGTPFGFLVLVPGAEESLAEDAKALRELVDRDRPMILTAVDRPALDRLRKHADAMARQWTPDVVIFDESFVNRDVPFAAFTASKARYDHWNQPGKTTFHSTTYQPNTISSLHFLRCLERDDSDFHRGVAAELEAIESNPAVRASLFRRLYSPSLLKTTRTAGFQGKEVRASGGYVYAGNRKVFDGVSGVACSIRGHNPPEYVRQIEALGNHPDCAGEVATRLRELTGLDCLLPAVSGATAIENALKLALVAQFPRRHILALKSGFGGKTLFALAGTWNSSYKERIDPLYPDVMYVDPFAADAKEQIDAALAAHPIAVVQMELIQAVGGVREVPDAVLRHLEARRSECGYLILIDEIQTGLHRTGPFTRARALGLTPDLTVIGKGTSDMMFPFALVLYTAAIQQRHESLGSDLPAALRQRYHYDFGYRTVLNVLRRSPELRLAERVAEAGENFAHSLAEELRDCKAVRGVRVYGLLIGIELETHGWTRRWLKKRLFLLYLLAMLRHRRFPVLVGFCQYEPNVLKLTPALTVEPEEIRAVCATLADVLRRPVYRLVATAVGALLGSMTNRRSKNDDHQRAVRSAHESVSR